jgi:5'-3' exonuclease
MAKFLLFDASNIFYRCKYTIRGDQSEKQGMLLHTLFSSLNKVWRTYNADHIIFAFDGKNNWRKDIYAPYKANRIEKRAKRTPTEMAEDVLFFEAFDIFKDFIKTKTNCTVLENDSLEADDLLAGFCQSHPNDTHIIISGDADFEQLLAPNVILYNGVTDTTTTLTGIVDYKGKAIIEKKTGNPKPAPDPQWSVFEKCMRGCTTDNIFSAYPGIREKGSKNKTGLREAFEDRYKHGFAWSSVMQYRWADHLGNEHKVYDDYIRNKQLVDLTDQPENIKIKIYETILNACVSLNRPMIGLLFLKLCGKFELQKISERANDFSVLLSAKYPANDK